MADLVKKPRTAIPQIGDRVSVAISHFGKIYEDHLKKNSIQKIIGTVRFKMSGKARVLWDLDKQSSDVCFDEIVIEDKDTPEQTLG